MGVKGTVGVAVATLWRTPGAVRPVDAPAVGVPSDTAAWVRGTSGDERVYEHVLTQLLLGERVSVVDEPVGGWVRVVALDQPAGKLDPRGYPGWLPAVQLVNESTVDGPRWTVDAPTTDLRDAPDGAVRIAGVASGTALVAAGRVRYGWLPVHVPGRVAPLWALAKELAPPADGKPVLEHAHHYVGTPYVWGGLTPYGIDCSGLVHVLWRRLGVTLPRDADDQFAATTPVPAGEERPGDLYFFAREGRPVHHVGLVTGDRRMLHACYRARRVLTEPVRGERLATLIGARRVP